MAYIKSHNKIIAFLSQSTASLLRSQLAITIDLIIQLYFTK